MRKRVFEGKCYNFALDFVNDRLLKRGRWTPEEAIEKSSRLSKKVQKTVNDFFGRPRRRVDHPIGQR